MDQSFQRKTSRRIGLDIVEDVMVGEVDELEEDAG